MALDNKDTSYTGWREITRTHPTLDGGTGVPCSFPSLFNFGNEKGAAGRADAPRDTSGKRQP